MGRLFYGKLAKIQELLKNVVYATKNLKVMGLRINVIVVRSVRVFLIENLTELTDS